MISTRIGHDHFLVWSLAPEVAASLVPDLQPWVVDGRAFLLCAGAEFHGWRWQGFPGMLPLRVAGWLVPCMLTHSSGRHASGGQVSGSQAIGNAFVRRFIDHPLIPWRHERIRIDGDGFEVRGIANGRRMPGSPSLDLQWFADDRCGVVRSSRGWHRWPIAKKSWAWRASNARLQAPWAEQLGAQAVGMITVAGTLARWGRPTTATVHAAFGDKSR